MRKSLFLALVLSNIFLIGAAAGARVENSEKQVVAKNEERKKPEEERWKLHLNVMKVFFEDVEDPQSRICLGITHKANPKVISKYKEKKHQKGVYARTQFNVLICESAPCEQVWSSEFVYTDEMGKPDTFAVTWKQIVFDGITPTGTIKRELVCCVNGECRNLEDTMGSDSASQTVELGRYNLAWTRSSLIIRRSDIMQAVINAGQRVEAY